MWGLPVYLHPLALYLGMLDLLVLGFLTKIWNLYMEIHTVELLCCGHLGDLVKCPV